jgi:hypothetical protein
MTAFGKHALRRIRAAGRVIGFARRNAVAELVRSTDSAQYWPLTVPVKLTGRIGEVARPVQQRRHLNESRIDALLQPRSLVIGVKEDPVLDDWSSEQSPYWFCWYTARSGEKKLRESKSVLRRNSKPVP